MCRGTILCCLIVVQVVQLSVASGSSLNVEQFQSGSDPGSSSLSLFPGPGGDSGLTGGNLGLSSSSDGLMVPFNNGGDFELAIGDKNCAPGPKRRGKRRARRDDQTFCPSNFQVRQIYLPEKVVGDLYWAVSFSGNLLTGLRTSLTTPPIGPRKQDNSRAVRKDKRPRLNCNRIHQKYQDQMIQTQTCPQSCWNSWTSHNPIPVFAPGA